MGLFQTKHSRKRLSSPHPTPWPPIHPVPPPPSRPVCGPVPHLQCSGSWSQLELDTLLEAGLLRDTPPPPPPVASALGAQGWGGRPACPADENSKCSRPPAANHFQTGRVRAGAAPGSINSALLQMAAGSSPASRFMGGWGAAAGGGPPPRPRAR